MARTKNYPAAKACGRVVSGFPKPEVCLGNALSTRGLEATKFQSVHYREGGLPSPFSMVMVVTKESLGVDLVSVGASSQGFPHPWKLFGWLDFQGTD
jgi:hypothetical protein